NGNLVIEVWGNIGTFTVAGGNDTMISNLLVSGTTAGSSQTVTTNSGSVLAGQTITATTGSIVSALDATTPVAQIVVGSQAKDLAAFRFTTTNDNYVVTEVVVKVANAAAASNITSLVLKDGVNILGTAPVSGTSATFSGLNVPVAANAYKVLTVTGNLGTVGFGAGNTGADIAVTLDAFKANNSQGVEDASGTADRAGNDIYVYKSIPTVAPLALPSTLLNAGTQTISKFSITSGANTVGWKKLAINVSKTSAPTIALASAVANGTGSVSLYDADTNTLIPGVITLANVTGTMQTAGAAADGLITFVATSEQSISGTKNYLIKASVGGSIVNGESVSTTFSTGVSAYAASNDYTTVAGTAATLVWSDQAGDPSTPTHDEAATSNDWNNEWLVKLIPTDSQTLSK
ncbi:MAG: hypothetical protein WCX80_05155, partial [Patescibacteria group bacterium]